MTTLRITTSAGEVVREPDRAALAAAIEAAGRPGPGAFVILDVEADQGAGPERDAPFLQAVRLPGTAWQVEVWRAAAERYRAVVADAAAVTRVFWSWAEGTGDWQRLRWQQVGGRPVAAAG